MLPLLKHLLHRPDQRGRQPATAFGWVLRQVDRGDFRHLCHAVSFGQFQLGISALRDLLAGLDSGCGARKDDGAASEVRAHHGHIARMILDALLLLEARLMRFIDDNQAKVAIGQEQR